MPEVPGVGETVNKAYTEHQEAIRVVKEETEQAVLDKLGPEPGVVNILTQEAKIAPNNFFVALLHYYNLSHETI